MVGTGIRVRFNASREPGVGCRVWGFANLTGAQIGDGSHSDLEREMGGVLKIGIGSGRVG